jgi:hypothetical protein
MYYLISEANYRSYIFSKKKLDYFSACMTVFSIQMDSINYFAFECSLCFPDSVEFKKNVCMAATL